MTKEYGLIVDGVVVKKYSDPIEAQRDAIFAFEESGIHHEVKEIHSFSQGKQIDQVVNQVKKLGGFKFYEFDDPYYSLVKAKDEKDAIEEYELATADNPEGVREIDAFTALLLFSRSVSEDGKQVPVNKILNEFFKNERATMIFDRHLL
ncbi:hypothetical protein FKN04_12235 [Bacillus glycinifermentans]|uniref:hypothetical protein n=1 Tax=Bacillus glycinifermentans TaxID=1664069 RepID=UPI001582A8EE|nr:hypothetical protein [Bacillus glycinifermentans]NUJ17348.1 hypothetical protein [Bacillus glycinifermentans]